MDTRKLEQGTRLVGATSWAAIASGAVIALALQTVLLLLGLVFATSVGDRTAGGGYAWWVVIVELISIAVGAALTASLSHAERRMSGVAAGVMTWAVALVLTGVFQGLTVTPGLTSTSAWAAFLGAIVSLGAAIVGGSFGASLGGSSRGSLTPTHRDEEMHPHPVAPMH